MNREKNMEKCLQILNTNQFVKVNSDPTKTTERKVRNILQKFKSTFSPNEYTIIHKWVIPKKNFCDSKNT